MLKKFSTAQSRRYRPGCFLIRADIPIPSRQAETIRAFRNACAIATTSAFYASRLANPNAVQWHVAWTDQFRFGHFLAGQNGWVQTFGGPVMGMDDDIPRQQAAAAFGNPTDFSFIVDQPLLERLFRAWRQCYLRQRNRKKFLRLFRALEVAFHASLFPADGLTSINDVGTRIALWVSAFEVLCHPGGGVNKRHVQKVISDAPYSEKALTSRRFTVSYGGNKFRATLPEALYDDLYRARNQFLHGMPVQPRDAPLSPIERLHKTDGGGTCIVRRSAGLAFELAGGGRGANGLQEAHDANHCALHEEPPGYRTGFKRTHGRRKADRMNPAARIRQPE